MYECINCDYTTSKKSDWNKHIITKKHKKLVSENPIASKKTASVTGKSEKKKSIKSSNERKFVCENCGHKYKFRSGLSRHEIKCNSALKVQEKIISTPKNDSIEVSNENAKKEDNNVNKVDVIQENDDDERRKEENRKMEEKIREQLRNEMRMEQEMIELKKKEIEMQSNKDVFDQVYNKLTSDTKALNEAFKTTILETIENQVIKKQQEQISDLQTMLKSSIENNKQTVSEMLPRIGNTTNITQQMTVNIFLNEECKNALNLNDFLRTLDLSIDDLLYTSENGYSKGIANIFVKKLQNLKPTERPIHCSDKDELHFYIKDQNVWEKDKENMKIDRSIEHITQKQIQKIKEWERGNPTWQHTDKDAKFYMNLIKEAVGGLTESERKENFEKIKKELGINYDISVFMDDDNDKIDNE